MDVNCNETDYELVDRLQGGDIEVFDQIFKKYSNRIFGFALKYLKSREEAEGLVQNVFLKTWENRKTLKKESSLKAYLFTIAYHNMCHIFRKRKNHSIMVKKAEHITIPNFELEKQMEYRFTLKNIDNLINKLPEKQRLIFIKSRKEGKSTYEIAEEMNLAPGTIDNNISLALKFLRKMISPENFV